MSTQLLRKDTTKTCANTSSANTQTKQQITALKTTKFQNDVYVISPPYLHLNPPPYPLFFYYQQQHLLFNNYKIEMQTPKKYNHPVRLQTTTATFRSKHSTIFSIPQTQNKLYTQVQTDTHTIKKQLHFQEKLGTSERIKISRNGVAEQAQYRKKMKRQLDNKFAACMIKQRVNTFGSGKGKRGEMLQKIARQMQIIFKELLWNVHQYKIKDINEYYFGLVLKNMNFINNILYDRKIVFELFHQLTPNILTIFLFIVHISLLNTYSAKLYDEADIKNYSYGLFLNEGIRFDREQVQVAFEMSKNVGKKRESQALNVNRQTRPTFVSLSHQKFKNNL